MDLFSCALWDRNVGVCGEGVLCDEIVTCTCVVVCCVVYECVLTACVGGGEWKKTRKKREATKNNAKERYI